MNALYQPKTAVIMLSPATVFQFCNLIQEKKNSQNSFS